MFYILCLNMTPTPLMTGGTKLAFLLIMLLCHKNESLRSHWLPGKLGNLRPGATGRIWTHAWNPEQL